MNRNKHREKLLIFSLLDTGKSHLKKIITSNSSFDENQLTDVSNTQNEHQMYIRSKIKKTIFRFFNSGSI